VGPTLTLPELRNLIYTFVIDQPHIHCYDEGKPNVVIASCLNLLLLCQKIREEVIPLFKGRKIRLPWYRAPAIVGSFGLSDISLFQKICVKLIIDINIDHTEPVDVLPLIKLRLRVPTYKLYLKATTAAGKRNGSSWIRDLNVFFGDSMWDFKLPEDPRRISVQEWQARRRFWVFQGIARVLVSGYKDSQYLAINSPYLDIKINKSYAQDWMSEPAPCPWTGEGCAYHTGPSKLWKRELGWDKWIYVKTVEVE
jgi:hypothetical protein